MADTDNEKVLVYHFRGEGTILKDNLSQRTRKQLREILEDNPKVQATVRRFHDDERDSKGDVHVEIRQKDLYTPEQKDKYKQVSLFNYYNNVAGVYVKHHEAQHFNQLVILSKKKD